MSSLLHSTNHIIVATIQVKRADLIAQGIVDPAKVTRSAVQNAASIAGMVLTTECLVVEKPEPKSAPAGGGGGGMGGMGF